MRFVTIVAFSLMITAFISSCQKEVELSDFIIHFEAPFPLNDLDFKDNQCLAVGGKLFEAGILVSYDVHTNEAQVDSILDKSLISIDVEEDIVCTGVYTIASNRGGQWKTTTVPNLNIMRGSIIHDDKIFAVGGAGLSQGISLSYNLDLSNLIIHDTSEHDLYFIDKFEDQIYLGGFGRFNNTKDFSEFENPELEGHFLDIVYSQEYGYYLLNASGSILHSDNGRVGWNEIRKPNSSGISDFKDLEIKADQIYVAAEDRIEFSSLNEIDWEIIVIEGMSSINALKAFNDRLYFVSETGKIASIAN